MSERRAYLLAVDAGSNQISVLRIMPRRPTQPVHGSPVSSGGIEPVSIAVHGRLVYVANAGDGGSNYTGFTLNRGGRLRPLGSSTVPLPDGSEPGDVLFNSAGTNLLGVRVNTSLIDSFAVGRDGRLTRRRARRSQLRAPGRSGASSGRPIPSQLYVSNAHGGAGNGTVSAFDVASDGTLSRRSGSPFPDLQTAPCWVEISHDGQLPLRRQHRQRQHLAIRDSPRRVTRR